MLLGLDPLLTPELLHALAAMGHGDAIVLADANFPAATNARRLIPLDGVGTPRALAAVLTLLPLDTFVDEPAVVMQVDGRPRRVPPAVRDLNRVLARAGGKPAAGIDRHEFYERARGAFAVVRTGERRFYANILLVKGAIDERDRVPKP
jgi:L-fucose mutarotase